MSQIYSIKNLLNIKDKNITFTENGISMENFKGVYSKIIHDKLSYSPNQCPHCLISFAAILIQSSLFFSLGETE